MADKALKVIGLMSGTSLDGIDVALIETNGEDITHFGSTFFRPYSVQERQSIERVTQEALNWNFKGPSPNGFARAEKIIDDAHRDAVSKFLDKNDLNAADIDLIGYHGQTILHRPPQNGSKGRTLQLGRGDVLAFTLGIDTVFDFRSHDVALGGQGAPLAPIYHVALLKAAGIGLPAAVLNIGGVSNVTVVAESGDIWASDCGPGNGPLDSWIFQNGFGEFDKDGAISQQGTPDFALIDKWLQREFFTKPAPKSADRWDFNVLADLKGQSARDGAATLAVFTAIAVQHTLRKSKQGVENIIVCGGGRKNRAIMGTLMEMDLGDIVSAEQIGLRGDDIEAEAFAYLAVRSIKGLPLSYPATTGISKPVTGGVLAKAGRKT